MGVIIHLVNNQIAQRAKMLRLVLLCLCALASTMAQNNNTRLFGGLGGLASAFNQITGNRPTQLGGNPFGGRPVGGNFQAGFGGNQGFNAGFNQGGFQGGFNQGGFNQGGFNQGGFGQISPVAPVVQGASCRRWCRTPQGQAYC